MKAIRLSLPCIVSIFLLTGCWDRSEINDIAFVVATGVDKGEKNQFLFSLQVPLPSSMGGAGSSGGGGGTSGEGPYLVAQGTGGNERQAMEEIQTKLSRRVYLGHRRVHIIGESLAEAGIKKTLNAVFTQPRSRISTFLLISKGDAVNLLKTQPRMEQYSGEGMREMSKNSLNMTVRSALQDLYREGKDMIIPMINTAGTTKTDKTKKEVQMQRFAVFKDDKLVFSTNKNESAGVLWLFEKMLKKSASFPVAKNEEISVQIFENQTKPKLKIVDGKPTFLLTVKTVGVLFENEPNYRIEDPQTYRLVISKMEGQIKKEIEAILNHAHSQGVDVFGFGWYLFKYKHQEWNQNWKNDWRTILPNLKVTIKVDADIQRSANSGIVEKE
ncbi:Ger(x)C family spore germination protein [Neobacillus cucumis]|uniref:Ger(x)C family spore germination protein n=1 Tax=Neobacillus cucumis TaxID=1740721 RepID=UPI001962931E|nr:Ger(x)C family spore germination protein [Neobacillus cucumis]MBM7655331.1 Ger(x)C family germination protein [Neobacillus cucumis]MED4223816.1 Ger(x)C family spore germination protein [Neobacillus cucumis]